MAPYDVPAAECIHAALPAALWAGHVIQPEALIVPEITSIVAGRSLAAPRLAVRIRLTQEWAPVQVPATVEPPAGRCTGCVVST